MKKVLFIFLLFFSFRVDAMGSFYISKRDIDSDDFVLDCDFLLYDSDGNVVDSWIQGNDVHVSNIPEGFYRLVERPLVVDTFSDYLSRTYDLSIKDDDVFELVLYNKKIGTPINLNSNSNYVGVFLIFIGCFFIFFSCKYKLV